MTKNEKNRINEMITLGVIILSITVMMIAAGFSGRGQINERTAEVEYRGPSINVEAGQILSEFVQRTLKGFIK